ncbi:ribosomal protein L15 [Gautieria morchelliformis]|nr:ribosomal protein L15 [Gautieria morchelliformis]
MPSRITLTTLKPAARSTFNQKRVGRGQGSGYGGTSGRGHNGQKSRSGNGKPKAGFEGGQTSIINRFPKRGFVNKNARTWAPVNLDRLQAWISQGRLSSSRENPITARGLLLSGCVHNAHDGIKVLGDGLSHLTSPVHIIASRASKSAISAIEAKGGSIFCRHYNPLALRDCLKGNKTRLSAAPTRKPDIFWYTNWENRGYLSREAVQRMPRAVTEDRWKELSEQLNRYRSQPYKLKIRTKK